MGIHALAGGSGNAVLRRPWRSGWCINLPRLRHRLAGSCGCGSLHRRCLRCRCISADRRCHAGCSRRGLLQLYLYLAGRGARLLLCRLRLVAFRHGPRVLRRRYFRHHSLFGNRAGIDFKTQVLYVRYLLNGSGGRRRLHNGTQVPGRFRCYLPGRLRFVSGRRGRLYAGVSLGDLPRRGGLPYLRIGVCYCKQKARSCCYCRYFDFHVRHSSLIQVFQCC